MNGGFTSRGWHVAIAAGIALGAVAISLTVFPFGHGSDFAAFHFAARVWLSGGNPYETGLPVMRATRIVPEPFYYPYPALLALAPFSLLPLRIAAAAFVGVSSFVLAYVTLRSRAEQLPLFFGAGFFVAAAMGQWSPLITATLLWPALSWLVVVKPNIGLAAMIARPSRVGVIGGITLLALTLLFQPTWPAEWLRNLRSLPPHPPPVLVPGGALALLAVLRWRRPEARLLAAMACVPQLMYFADQLPLWLVPRTRRESMLLSTTSVIAWTAALIVTTRAGLQPALTSAPFVLAGVYLPALVMVLRRSNEGTVPAWLERATARLPSWARGVSGLPGTSLEDSKVDVGIGT